MKRSTADHAWKPCMHIQCVSCLQVGDRKLVQERMVRHVQQPDATPLLVFPEGTCGV